MNTPTQNILVLILAVALDRFLPEPPNRMHPVAWMGWAIDSLRSLAPAKPTPALLFGGLMALGLVGASGLGAPRGGGGAAKPGGSGRGIAVRDCTSFGLPEHIHIAIGRREECAGLVEALEEESARDR